MNILITGVNGFIGTALWNYFKFHKFPFKVFGIDVQLRSPAPHLSTCDLNNPVQLKKILNRIKPGVIFHLAGGRPVDEDKLWQVNIIPTKILLDVVVESKGFFPCIVIPGSAAEYGKVAIPKKRVSEDVDPQPLAWYGFVKYMQTSLGLMYARKGLDVRIARIFNIGGYGTPPSLALGNFAQRIVQIEKKELSSLSVGSLSGLRDFLDIEDVCSALWAVVSKGKMGEVYNVCSSQSVSMRQLLGKLIKCSKTKNIIFKEKKENISASFDIVGDNSKLRCLTGWRPKVSIEQSLENTLRYYRSE